MFSRGLDHARPIAETPAHAAQVNAPMPFVFGGVGRAAQFTLHPQDVAQELGVGPDFSDFPVYFEGLNLPAEDEHLSPDLDRIEGAAVDEIVDSRARHTAHLRGFGLGDEIVHVDETSGHTGFSLKGRG